MKRFSIHMPEPLITLLDKDAKNKGVSRAEVIRQIVQRYYEDKNFFTTKLKKQLFSELKSGG